MLTCPDTVYPLHPLVTVVAPMLLASLAQNDRTLTGFLAGDEPHTLIPQDHGLPADTPARRRSAEGVKAVETVGF